MEEATKKLSRLKERIAQIGLQLAKGEHTTKERKALVRELSELEIQVKSQK